METHAVERSETTESDLWEMAADTIAGVSEECRAALIGVACEKVKYPTIVRFPA